MTNKTLLTRRHWINRVSAPALVTSLGAGLIANDSLAAESITGEPESATQLSGARVFNIRTFGAKGDGQSLDTAAVQAAIDACHQDRGGIVLVPAGVFVIGTVELKSDVTLHIAAQGKLLGSGDGKQYHGSAAIPLRGEHTMGDGNVGLIFAANSENITIEGMGTIDGQGGLFRSTERGVPPPAGISGRDRPHHLLFYQCRNLNIRDIFLKDCAFHSVRICVCTDVKVNGIRIESRVNHNNDGFHFISCQHVHVSNCKVRCQDDAFALFGSNKFVTVTNCSFSTRWSVFRFGGGHCENIAVSNCLIYETYGCPIKLRCDSQSRFENMAFSNLIMNGVTGPISIGLGPQRRRPDAPAETPGVVRNISFSGIRATVVKPGPLSDATFQSNYRPAEPFSCIVLNGMDEGFMENISFDDVHVTFPGGGTLEHAAVRNVPKIASEYYEIGVPPAYGMFARNVRGLTLNNARFDLAATDLRPAMVFDTVRDASVNGFSADANTNAESLLRFIESRDVLISGARVLSPAAVFLLVEGDTNENIIVDGGDLSKAAAPVVFKNGASKQAVKLRL